MRIERKRSRLARGIVAVVLVLACATCQSSPPPPLVTRPAGPPPRIRITNVFVFDGRLDRLTPPQDVVLDRGRVEGIVRKGMLAAEGELVIDGTGHVLMPGLVDVHGHTGSQSAPSWSSAGRFPDPARNLQSYLYAGVTTVFDPGDLAPDVFDRREAVARDELLGPRIFAAGPIFTTPGGHPVGVLHGIVPWWIRWYVLKAIVEEARAHGIRTVAHIGTVADALAAADAGVAAWMHGVYKEPISDEALARFKAARIPYVATTFVFDDYADLVEGKRTATALERETVPADVLASLESVPPDGLPGEFRDFMKLLAATRDVRCDNVRRVSAAGIPILAGADAQLGVFPGPALHREIDALIRCGVPPVDALRAATSAAARFVTGEDEPEFGIVRSGGRADLLLVNGNPLVEPAALHSLLLVIKDGRILERHPLAGAGPTAPPRGS